MKKILVDIKDQIAFITINNPEKMNCIDMEMLSTIEHALLSVKKEKSAHVIVIRGAGERAFSAGGNLKELAKLNNFQAFKAWISYGNEVFNLLETMPVATVAAIDGYAIGGGLELALACDIRLATENSQFSMPELNHGWIPGWGALARLRRLIGEPKAKEMIMLCEPVSGNKAKEIGLVNKVCEKSEFQRLIHDTCEKLLKTDPFVLEMSKFALMDHSRTNSNNDLLYDILASAYSFK